MKSFKFILSGGILSLLTSSYLMAASGMAVIKGTTADSKLAGKVMLQDTKDGLKVSADFTNAPAGKHGFHIHEFGSCDDSGKAAGSHYNPNGHPHGNALKDIQTAHAGDLGNIDVKADGTGKLEAIIPDVSLSTGAYNVAGRAIILHEKEDDFGQPTGNAGGRIGCGPIVITGE